MSRFGTAKEVFLLALALGLWAFFVYVRWVATREELLFISRTEIDLVAHIAGGLFLGGLLEWRRRRSTTVELALFVAVIAFGWETIELFFDPAMQFFYANAFDLWLLDSLGDIAAAALGGYGYWVFLKKGRA